MTTLNITPDNFRDLKVQTKDGQEVELLAFKEGQDFPVIGIYFDGDHWATEEWNEFGSLSMGGKYSDPRDLVPAPKKVESWINVYPDGMCANDCLEEAEEATVKRIALLKITYNADTGDHKSEKVK